MRTRTFVSVTSLVALSLVGTAQGAPGGGGGTTIPGHVPPIKQMVPFNHYGPGPDLRVATYQCADPPTLALCNIPGYLGCSAADAGQKGCTPILQAAAAAHQNGANQTCLMDATGDHCIPTPVKKYPTVAKSNPGTDWQAQEAAAMANARAIADAPWSPNNPWAGLIDPATYSRNPKWKDKTKPVNSCEAYVYAKYYDYERFLDSAYACGGNDQCVFDMAYQDYANPNAGAPRIANRILRDRENAPIVARDSAESDEVQYANDDSAVLPKNAFYTAAAFMTPALFDALNAAWADDPAMVAKLHLLQTQLGLGYNFYNYGKYPDKAVEFYPTSWAFHLAMNNRTKPQAYPHAQQMEFLHRNELASEAVWGVLGSLACRIGGCVTAPLAIARMTPGMAEGNPSDPFGLASMLTRNEPLSAALQGAMESMLRPDQIPAAGMTVNLGTGLNVGALDIGQIGAPIGGHMMKAKKAIAGQTPPTTGRPGPTLPLLNQWTGFPADYWTTQVASGNTQQESQLKYSSYILNSMQKSSPPVVEVRNAPGSATHPRLDCAAPSVKDDATLLASCTLTNIVLDEWARSFAGNVSCLDMTGYACDWSPVEFRESVIGAQRMQRSRETDYKECLRYTGNSFVTASTPNGKVPASAQVSAAGVKGYIAGKIAQLKTFNDRMPHLADPGGANDPLAAAKGTIYGDHKHDNQQWGNSTFGAGYSYDLGWDAAVLERAPGAVDTIKAMQLDFGGKFEAHATAFGNDISLLQAELGAQLNDNNQGKVFADHYLYIIGFGAFDQLDKKGFREVATINQNIMFANPSKDFKENVFDAGFWVGPVYVHVGLDVEFFFSAPLYGSFGIPDHGASLSSSQLIAANLTFKPQAGVSADLYAYGGWGPIAEVGVEAKLNLITVGIPMSSTIAVESRKGAGNSDVLWFVVKEGIDVSIDTLSGELDLCGKILGIGGCTEIVSWKGLHQEFPLFPPLSQQFELAEMHDSP